MPLVTAWLKPTTEIKVDDRPYGTQGHRVTAFTFDDVTVHVIADDDAGVAATVNMLIGALLPLRDAALRRRGQEQAAHDAADPGLQGGYGSYEDLPDVPLADPGDHFAGIDREGDPAFNGALNRW